MAPSDPPPWSDLPYHILGLVIDRLASSPDEAVPVAASASGRRRTFWSACSQLLRRILDNKDTARFRAAYRSHTDAAADCARFRAVCRSWRAAGREQMPRPPGRLPWTVLSDGSFMTGFDDEDAAHRLRSWPNNGTCLGATNDWLAIQCADYGGGHIMMNSTYRLHNPFSAKTILLKEIDAVIGETSKRFEVRKVIMRSTPCDVIAFMTNNYNYPIILVRPGKGVWLPRPRSAPFIYIIDMVFIGDKLYGITKAEDLISLDIACDGDGKPIVTRTKRVIRHEPESDDDSEVWDHDDFTRVPTYFSALDDGYDLWSDVDDKYRQDDDAEAKDEEDDETIREEREKARDKDPVRYNIRKYTGDDTIREAFGSDGPKDDHVIITWHIIESLGKLLMVRRKVQWNSNGMNSTRSADVFEANITTASWMLVTAGLDGQALFISRFNCKSIHACGEVEKDAVYFVDTGDVLNMKSRIIRQPQRDLSIRSSMWIFPPEI